jgi:hypothetical protein
MFEQKIQSVILKLQAALDDARKVDAGKTGAPGARMRQATLDVQADLKHIREALSEKRAAAANDVG